MKPLSSSGSGLAGGFVEGSRRVRSDMAIAIALPFHDSASLFDRGNLGQKPRMLRCCPFYCLRVAFRSLGISCAWEEKQTPFFLSPIYKKPSRTLPESLIARGRGRIERGSLLVPHGAFNRYGSLSSSRPVGVDASPRVPFFPTPGRRARSWS